MSIQAFFKRFLVFQIVMFAVAAIPHLLFGAEGWDQYANGLLIIGLAALIVAAYGYMGSWGTTRSAEFMYGSTVSDDSMRDTTHRAMKEHAGSLRDMIVMGAIGLFPVVVALVIKALV